MMRRASSFFLFFFLRSPSLHCCALHRCRGPCAQMSITHHITTVLSADPVLSPFTPNVLKHVRSNWKYHLVLQRGPGDPFLSFRQHVLCGMRHWLGDHSGCVKPQACAERATKFPVTDDKSADVRRARILYDVLEQVVAHYSPNDGDESVFCNSPDVAMWSPARANATNTPDEGLERYEFTVRDDWYAERPCAQEDSSPAQPSHQVQNVGDKRKRSNGGSGSSKRARKK
eukprot:TRINITY_DN523_c1_g2_i1.p1 TRINITY_DN523_c1_g2~~TRINITY_DN523_c1_g2_i1.p1  ORF type:complete len:229 (-),score=23.31 TRINITY_DN523_c1_g2_i1:72-758(-)